MTLHYTIPGAPITKKNSMQICVNRKTGQRFVRQSAQYEDYANAASYFLKPKPAAPIASPVAVKCVYYMPTRRRVDLTNLLAATHDILVLYGILADDNRDVVASVDGSRALYDKANPRTEIEISPVENYGQWKGDTNGETRKDPGRKTESRSKARA